MNIDGDVVPPEVTVLHDDMIAVGAYTGARVEEERALRDDQPFGGSEDRVTRVLQPSRGHRVPDREVRDAHIRRRDPETRTGRGAAGRQGVEHDLALPLDLEAGKGRALLPTTGDERPTHEPARSLLRIASTEGRDVQIKDHASGERRGRAHLSSTFQSDAITVRAPASWNPRRRLCSPSPDRPVPSEL